MPGPSRNLCASDPAYFLVRGPDLKKALYRALDDHSIQEKKALFGVIDTYRWCLTLEVELYGAWVRCRILIRSELAESAMADSDRVSQVAKQVDNMVWLLDILFHRRVAADSTILAEEYLILWAEEDELLKARASVSAMNRYNISRVTAKIFMGIGEGKITSSPKTTHLLLRKWLVPYYEDFALMKKFRPEECDFMEDALSNVVLTLTVPQQEVFFLAWVDRVVKSGDNCLPILKKGVGTWWMKDSLNPNKGS